MSKKAVSPLTFALMVSRLALEFEIVPGLSTCDPVAPEDCDNTYKPAEDERAFTRGQTLFMGIQVKVYERQSAVHLMDPP